MVSAGGNLRLGFRRLHATAALVEDCVRQRAGCGPRQLIAHARCDLDGGTLRSDLRSGDAGAPLLDVDRPVLMSQVWRLMPEPEYQRRFG